MRKAIRRPLAIISCGAAVLAGGVAYATAGEDGAATGPTVAAVSTAEGETSYVYRSFIQQDTIHVRDGKGTFAPYSVATERRLETWTAPDGSTLTRQTCLSARNADPQSERKADPSNGQACQTSEYRLSKADLNAVGLLDSEAGGTAARIEAVAGTGASPVERASLAASVALNPAATAGQRKAAEELLGRLAGAVTTTGNGKQSVHVSGDDGSVELEFDAATGDVTAYRESGPESDGKAAVSDRTITQIATVANEGEVPAP